MRPLILPFLALCLAGQDPLALKAPITRVRLHPDEAWVTRTAHLRLEEGGVHRLQVADLPPGLRLDDLQVSAKGPSGSRLGDVSVQADPRTVTETPEWKQLEAEQDGLKDRRDGLESQAEALGQEEAYLKALQATQDKEISARLVYGKPDLPGLLELGKGIQGRLAQVLQQERKLKRDLGKLALEEQRLQAEMQKQQGKRRTAPSRVTVELSTPGAGSVDLELSYRNRQARWTPVYEARLAEDRKHLGLALYAAVTQKSGEDWDGVRLEISNARPSRSLAFAKYEGPQNIGWMLQAMDVASSNAGANISMESVRSVPKGRDFTQMAQFTPGVVGGVPAENQYMPAPQPAPPSPAEEQNAQTIEEASGLSTTFSLEGAKDVPSDGEPHRFKVLARDLEPSMALVTTPRLDATAYQVARFATPGGFPLFPGSPVTHYAGAQRLGEAPLLLPPAGQPFTLGFGPYKGLRVSFRRADLKQETVGAFSKERQWTWKDRFELSSDGAEALEVEVQDRTLKSTDEKVKVTTLPETTPGFTEPVPGVRTWKLHLEPKGGASVTVATQVRAPQDGVVTGLDGLQ